MYSEKLTRKLASKIKISEILPSVAILSRIIRSLYFLRFHLNLSQNFGKSGNGSRLKSFKVEFARSKARAVTLKRTALFWKVVIFYSFFTDKIIRTNAHNHFYHYSYSLFHSRETIEIVDGEQLLVQLCSWFHSWLVILVN